MTEGAERATSGRLLPAAAACLAAGLLLSFAFPAVSAAPIAWVALVPLLGLAARVGPGRGAVLGLAFGVGFFGSLVVWLSIVGWAAWFAAVLIEASFIALFGAVWAVTSRVSPRWWVVLAPSLWVATEALRGVIPFRGFAWGELAQSQVAAPWLLRAAGLGGGRTVSLILVAVNVLLVRAWRARGMPRRAAFAAAAAGVLVAVPAVALVGNAVREDSGGRDTWRVAIVQGNVIEGQRIEDEHERVRRHVELTTALAGEGVDLVVWPESSVAIDPLRDPEIATMVGEAARAVDAPMIVGANLDVDEDRYLVVALLVGPDGRIVDRYQKTHLVPFGEYLPFRAVLGGRGPFRQVPRDAVPGNEGNNLVVHGTPVATVISFETDFGPLVRARIGSGARVLVVATNTSTWNRSWASIQHVAMSQVRAAENGVPVVHAALSGISAFIAPTGTIVADLGLYEEGSVVRTIAVAASSDITIYARTGDWLAIGCALIALGGLMLALRRAGTVPG